jgi:methylase of polypeptide subunit release factors
VDYLQVQYKNIRVSYLPELDGGGMDFGQEYIWVLEEKFGRVGHLFEFCAGPGFIGFSLLAHGLCERLTLADINPAAVEACRATVKENRLESKVAVYQSDCLDDIPPNEKWDLVVSNPPHWRSGEDAYVRDMRMWDPDLRIHDKFYRSIRPYLKPGGAICIQENGSATKAADFLPMIEANGLVLVEEFKAKPISLLRCLLEGRRLKYARPSQYYYLLVRSAQ